MRIGVGLSIPELATRGGRFSPASLFTGGVQGAWYDPSDYSTLFQDSSGTTPVTAVEQPVGLMLDKSQGLVLGSELVTTTNMTAQNANGTVAVVGSTLVATCTVNGLYGARFNPTPGTVLGKSYLVTVTISQNSANKTVSFDFGGSGRISGAAVTTSVGSKTAYAIDIVGQTLSVYVASGVAGESFTISLVSVREIAGNHASQATAASRPVLRARYNQLTYSEDFSNAAWSKTGITVGAAVTPPSGTSAAYEITSSATSIMRQTPTVLASNHIAQIYAKKKPGATDWVMLQVSESGIAKRFWFNVGNGTIGTKTGTGTHSINDAGNGWYRCSVAFATSAGTCLFDIEPVTADGGNTGDSAYIGGTDLRLASTSASAPTYQRIAAATDYATAGFLPYLYFVTDDSFSTGAINLSGTDKVSVITGYTKLSDSAVGMLYELGIDPTTTNGTFNFVAPQSTVDGSYRINVRGTTTVQVNTAARAAPVTDVSSMLANIAGPSVTVRLNGAVAASSTSSMGTGNFANTALYIGRRNNSNFPINGNFYGYILCGKTLSASELSATESWMAAKTGVTL